MARSRQKSQACGAGDARKRLADAKSFLDVAELAGDVDDSSLEYGSVAASVAVLAGIAASDAACCEELGKRSRSQSHHDAEGLLSQISPGGKQAASQLRQLVNLKDTAQYGLISVTATELKRALRQAAHLVEFAEEVLRR